MDAKSPRIADEIALRNPCRIIALQDGSQGKTRRVKAKVLPIAQFKSSLQVHSICYEYIALSGTTAALERIGGMIPALLIGGLPKFLWWKATPDPNNALFKRLAAVCNNVMVDSCEFNPESDLLNLQKLVETGVPLADLNWRGLSAWQELTAEAYNPPLRRASLLQEVFDRVTIDYEKGNPAQALMFLGWLASRLEWSPVSCEKESGDYQISKISFLTQDQRQVQAELAGVPVADGGRNYG